MNSLLLIFFCFIFVFLINNFFKNKNWLLSHSGDIHQKFVEKNSIPLTGGIYLSFLFSFILFKIGFNYTIIFIYLFLFLGIASDNKIIKSPKVRLLLQTIIIMFFVYFNNLEIINSRIVIVDKLLELKIFNYLFVVFCLLILINGSNFVDGLNGLLIGYFIIISVILLKLNFFSFYNFNEQVLKIYFLMLFFIFFMNLANKLYLGDSGVYVISVFYGFLLINFHINFPLISPYFFILLLWYPCFENLFSIIRKFRLKRSPISPDTKHLHQLLFYFLKKKNSFKDITNNNLSSILILGVNIVIFLISISDIYSTNLQILSLIFSIFLYVISYVFLFSFKYKGFKI